jgi:endo-1,4-beta-xylanase
MKIPHIPQRKYRAIVAAFIIFLGLSTLYAWNRKSPAAPSLPSPSLKQLAAEKDIDVGNFAIRSRLNEEPYSTILHEQFNLALADNTPNWYFNDGGLRPSESSYYFDHMDEVMAYAERHNMAVQAHHYVWGEEKWLPDWLKNGQYSDQETLTLMEEHIQTVGRRYSGRIQEWTVVNEAFSRGQRIYGLRDWWADNTGGNKDEYIDRAFIAARKADPKSKLILNDFGNESINSISDEMYAYVASAKARGIPIDGVGMQMHIDGVHPPTKDEVKANMKRFGDLGVAVYVTEFDVNMNDVPAPGDVKNKLQENIYYEMARACIESDSCQSFALLGITDGETWYAHMGLEDSRPLPFDKQYRPKPAFYGMYRAFSEE